MATADEAQEYERAFRAMREALELVQPLMNLIADRNDEVNEWDSPLLRRLLVAAFSLHQHTLAALALAQAADSPTTEPEAEGRDA